jgi:DNA invertase Pin-like site-specific DNA recombinase
MNLTTNRTALYIRVSTEDQDLVGQERELRAYAISKNLEVVKVYAEKVSATGRVEREVYEQVLQNAAQPHRPWDHLMVWSLDRWSREERFTRAIATIEDLEARGVRFHSLKEPLIDSSEDGTPNMGRDVLRAILPVIASFESRRRADRVRVAMKELKEGRRGTRSGRPVGRPRRLTYKRAQRVQELREQGLPWWKVAQLAGLPVGTCRRAAVLLSEGTEK